MNSENMGIRETMIAELNREIQENLSKNLVGDLYYRSSENLIDAALDIYKGKSGEKQAANEFINRLQRIYNESKD